MRIEKIEAGKYRVFAIQDNGIERQPMTIERVKRGQRKWAIRRTGGMQGIECRCRTFTEAKRKATGILPFWNMS